MSTSTKARATKSNAKKTARSASATARSATTKTSTTTRREARKAERGVVRHGRRVVGAAQAEVSAVASQPTRPLFFALGIADRTAAGVKALPGTVLQAPARTRARVVDAFATAGDLAERAQRGYTEVAQDGEKLVRAIRRQESTQQAVTYAERAQTRAERAVKDTEKAVEAGTEAAAEAVSKLG
jgi:hypothetical protein